MHTRLFGNSKYALWGAGLSALLNGYIFLAKSQGFLPILSNWGIGILVGILTKARMEERERVGLFPIPNMSDFSAPIAVAFLQIALGRGCLLFFLKIREKRMPWQGWF